MYHLFILATFLAVNGGLLPPVQGAALAYQNAYSQAATHARKDLTQRLREAECRSHAIMVR